MIDETPLKDWLIGLTVKPKMRSHGLYYERGEILAVYPSGTDAIIDHNGVLKIRLGTGRVLMVPASEWVIG